MNLGSDASDWFLAQLGLLCYVSMKGAMKQSWGWQVEASTIIPVRQLVRIDNYFEFLRNFEELDRFQKNDFDFNFDFLMTYTITYLT